MKLLSIALVLAILTGCRASTLIDDWEKVGHYFEEYFRNVSKAVDEEDEVFQNSSLCTSIRDHIDKSFSNISRRFNNLEEELKKVESVREVREAFDLVMKIAEGVVDKAHRSISEIASKIRHPTEELYEVLRPAAAPHVKPVLEKLRKVADALLSEIQAEKKTEAEQSKLKMQELETEMGPEVKEVLEELEEFQVALQPYADEVQEHIKNDLVSAAESLKPYVAPILNDLRKYAQAVEKWASTPLFPEDHQSSSL